MAAEYSRGLLRVCVAQLCQSLGWNAIQTTPLELMTDILERYLIDLGKTTQRYCEQFGRLDPNLDDLGLAFCHLGIPLGELEEYVRHLDPVLFAHNVVSFPVAKGNNFQFPNPKSLEIQQEREEHVPDHLPYMFPGMEAEPGEQNQTPCQSSEEPITSQEDKSTPVEASPVASGEKRAVSSPGDGLPSKRMRLSSSNLPEEAGHSQYEMMSVTMSQTGHLTPTRGQGKLPDARTPPPGLCQPISSVESDRRKKDSERDRERSKIKGKKALSRSEGGMGLPTKSGNPNEKENLSEDLKARLKSMKTFDAKKFRKDPNKRTSSLKSFKFGKSLYKPSKSKSAGNSSSFEEMLFSDPFNIGNHAVVKVKSDKDKQKVKKKPSTDTSQHPELERLMLSGDGVRTVKSTDTESELDISTQPESSLDPVTVGGASDDSDDELSEEDSPVRRLVIAETDHTPRDTEIRKKERLRRIDDILDSVIKSSMGESDESSSFSETPLEARKELFQCVTPKSKSRDKDKEKSKQKSSSVRNTSSVDLDACINFVVRQSAEESSKKDDDTTCTSEKDTCSDQPKVVSRNFGSKKQKIKKKLKMKPGKTGKGLNKVRERLKEKIKSRSISQDSSELESESSAKPEKVYPPQYGVFDFPPDSPEDSGPLAPLHPPASVPVPQTESPVHKTTPPLEVSPEKQALSEESSEIIVDKIEEPFPAVELLKLALSKEKTKHKERSKEKEHKKDRKDKKKDKEKKKKNKDRDKSKDREKKEKHRDKHDREDKSEGSMPMTVPKLKLKIGGISVGGASSNSVTIAKDPIVPKDSTPSPDEIKPPLRPEIPRLVIKPVPRRPLTDSPVKPVVSPPPVKPSPPTASRPPPPPGFKAIPESEPVTKAESSMSPPKPLPSVMSPPKTVSSSPPKEEAPKSSPPKPTPPTPPMLPKFRPIPPVSSSPPPVRNIISPPTPPPQPPPPVKEESPPKPESPPKVSPPPSPPPKPKSPSPSPSLSPLPSSPPPKEEPPKSPEKPKPQTPPRPDPPPIFYPAPPRRTASLSPRSREPPLYSTPPPKRKNSSPRGRKPSSPARSNSTPPKRKTPTTSPGRKKGSPKGAKKKAALRATGKGNLSSPPPSTFQREEEHPAFAPAKPVVKSLQSFSKEETPSPAPSPAVSPSPSPPPALPNPTSGQSELPPPPPPSKPQPLQRAVFAETVGTSAVSSWDDTGQRIWICPTCKLPDDGSPMIGCDKCDEWYHWPCVSIVEPPPEDEDWYCPKCRVSPTKGKGKGKGAKRGRKKKVK